MSLDPELRTFLAAATFGPTEGRTPTERRQAILRLSDELFAAFSEPAGEVFTVADVPIPVAGGHIRLRIYRPGPETGLPVHLFFHGGGWWLGSIDEDVVDATCRERCLGARCIVVAADYRLAPQHRFPTAVEDCYAALLWTHEHATEFGGDPGTISVGGVSAGANLAAATAIAARDRRGPALALQLLEVPPLDLTLGLARTVPVGDGYGMTLADMQENTAFYFASPEEANTALASPALVADTRGLAPARIMTAEFDPLRRDGEYYAERLREAGIPVEHTCYPGAIHGSLSLTGAWPPARRWRRDLIDALAAAHSGARAGLITTDASSGD